MVGEHHRDEPGVGPQPAGDGVSGNDAPGRDGQPLYGEPAAGELVQRFDDAKVVVAESMRPGNCVVISWNNQPLPSGSRKDAEEG